jgi:5-methylcytosine-specific restriction endonuclease McrA
MQPHIVNYHKALGIDLGTWIACEVCNATSVDIHHIIPRSKFGSKRKAEQYHVNNLVALCRVCHNLAHDNVITKEQLQIIVSKRISL